MTIPERINNPLLITQKITETKQQITEIKKIIYHTNKDNYDNQELVKLWYLKKNLLQLNDPEELKIYQGISQQEAIKYTRKMIIKIKNLLK